MRLAFVKRHLSILAFPTIEVPPLTIVVGLNGSGKSHLLQAIENGSISNSVAPVDTTRPRGSNEGPVRLLTLNGSPLGEGNPYMSSETQPNPGMHMHQGFEGVRRAVLAPFAAKLNQLAGGRIAQTLRPNDDIWRLGVNEAVARSGDESNRTQIEQIFREAEDELLRKDRQARGRHAHMNEHFLSSISTVASKLGIPPLTVTARHEEQFRPWQTDQFQNNLPSLFGRYRDIWLRNQLAKLQDQKENTSTSMTDERFVAQFGEAPWKQISETFSAFRLPYEAAAPDLFGFSQVQFSLVKHPSGEPVSVANLSSGEKVLLQFALSSYQYDETIVNVRRPAVLLLDEMDAPLHPEMVHRWLGAISNGLVTQQGVHCIVTTHSPTTVALAPEDALYEMRDGVSGLTKITKQDALNRLTFGVPTLSIDYSGRRQIFTESDTDAAIYERIYSLTKSQLDCKRELNFVSTGMRNKDGGEINSGCAVVTNLVQRLNDHGNMSVFGVVDWDGSAVSTDRVRVISEGTHDGIENLLLDPLLICLLLLKERRAPETVRDIARFAGADRLSSDDIQRLVDAVQQSVLPSSTAHSIDITYLNGASARVLRDYLTMDDHALEDALKKTFPYLRKWSNRGALVLAVIDEVLTEHRGFCPAPLKDLFESIANA